MSSTFAPVYAQKEHFSQRLSSKRPHAVDEYEQDSSSDDNTTGLPITRRDPYYIAGWSREKPLPPYPFPHAAIVGATPSQRPIDEQLHTLKPPLLAPHQPIQKTITKRTHLDNLTTILHRCVKSGDWKRAYRCVGLLLRSEHDGRGIDLRQNGTWMIVAEVLIRSNDSEDDGLQAARKFYERLILQYPYTMRSSRSWNASAVYPSLFNIWIYQVQLRSRKAQDALAGLSPARRSDYVEDNIDQRRAIRQDELAEANEIASRLQQLTSTPPYDTDAQLLSTNAMVSAWVRDLQHLIESGDEGDRGARVRSSLEAQERTGPAR